MLSAAPIFAIAATLGTEASAQDAARPIPSLGDFSLTPSGPQAAPTPSATPVPVPPAPTLSPPAIAPTPVPHATPTPRKTSVPKPTPMASATPIPAPTPADTPMPRATATPAPSPVPVASPARAAASVAPAPRQDAPLWPWLAGAVLLMLGGFWIWWIWSRRRRTDAGEADALVSERVVVPEPPVLPRAWLALALRPTRAGLNMLSATVECAVTVVNRGDAPATYIRIKPQLMSASGDQDAAVATFAAEPIVRPAIPAFALAPGEERRLRAVVALPRDAIRPMTASGRPMFIPLVALNALYAAGEGVSGQTVQAFAVGVERVDSPKLAPFWLDGSLKMHDMVAARPHAVAVER